MAVVRYAAPAFWSRADFDKHDASRQVLNHSSFVAPARIKDHRRWMYDRPNGKAYFNPDFEVADNDGWESVVRNLRTVAKRQTLRDHVRSLVGTLPERGTAIAGEVSKEWIERVQRYGRFSREDIELLMDLKTVTAAAEVAEASWTVLVELDGEWSKLGDIEFLRGTWPWWPYWLI